MNEIRKLGILVVYLLDDSDEPILDLHLSMIERNTTAEHTIYAVANRLSAPLRSKLEGHRGIRMCAIKDTALRVSREHAYYLEALADQAIADGCSHLCTFDVDSFPIVPSWEQALVRHLSTSTPIVAISREENGDRVLAHPSCMFFGSDFWNTYRPRFLPTWRDCDDTRCRIFLLRNPGERDTGIGISYTLQKNNLRWHRMLRSNRVNDHYLLGGIYDDVVFHLGAGSRGKKHFRSDMDSIHLGLIDRTALKAGRYLPMQGLKERVTRRALRNRDTALSPIHEKNQAIYEKIRASLLADPDKYFEFLLGKS